MTDKNALEFGSLDIKREEYGTNKGKLKALVRTSRWDSKLEVTLPDDVVNEIMKMIAPAIAASVAAALIDTQRDHETWMIENHVGDTVDGDTTEPLSDFDVEHAD